MDKNLINIDDLFRQRLSGGEEEERSGAWLNMRDLLDEQMPVKPVGFPWRRMLSYTAGLLLLASAAIGGYEAVTAHRAITNTNIAATGNGINHNNNNNTTNNPLAISAKTTGDNIGHVAAISSTTHPVKAAATTTNTTPPTKYALAANASTADKKGTTSKINTGIASNIKTVSPATGKKTAKVKAGSLASAPASGIVGAASSNVIANNTASAKVKHSLHHHQGTATIALGGNALANANTVTKTKHGPRNASNIATNTLGGNLAATSTTAVKHTLHHTPSTPANTVALNTTTTTTGTGKRKKAKANILPAASIPVIAPVNTLPTIDNSITATEQQKMDKVEVVQRNITKPGDKGGRIVNDTVDKSEVSINKAVQPASQTGSNTNQTATTTTANSTIGNDALAAKTTSSVPFTGNNLLLASAAKSTTTTTENTGVVTRRSSKKSNILSNFAEMILDFRTNLGNARFAPGITGGINATFFAPNSISGFQLGITGDFILNDNWSFIAQFKYFNRFAGNSIINDNYVNYSALSNGGYQKDSVQQNFRYNSLQSLELPVALQYNFGKLGVFAGGNVVYNFSIYNDLETNMLSREITSQPGRSIKPQYAPGDFSSRFGLGYLLGARYDITPLLHGDVRLVQTVWDNSSTSGGQSLSSNLYKHPSLQLSIGYTFKKQESKMP